MIQKKPFRVEIILMALSVVIFGCFIAFVVYYYGSVLGEAGRKEEELNHVYRYQYKMIVDSRNSALWDDVFEKAKIEASKKDVLLSMLKSDWNNEYDKIDYVEMCIASKVDGIILEYNGETGLAEKIDEAADKGIPVITIMNDPNKSARQSYVGVNDYQMGQAYGTQVAELVDENTRKILILSNREPELEKNQMYSQIYNAVYEKTKGSGNVRVREENLISINPFDVEEAVRNIFQAADGPPEILVCLDEVTTESAYQAMVDFNLVGEVAIVGYYSSDVIMDAVRKGLIPVTITMNAEQIARYSIEALTEYWEVGRSNTYYTVDLDVIKGQEQEEES